MLKQWLIALIGRERYVNRVMTLNNLLHAFWAFRHPAANLMREKLIPSGGTVLDIGANIGRFSALAAETVGKQGQVYAFEPVPFVLQTLHDLVRYKGLQQVTVFETALGLEEGEAEIRIPLKDGWKPLVPIAHLGSDKALSDAVQPESFMPLKIKIQRLDDVCERLGMPRIDFIKCDVEGAEPLVFGGGMRRLASDLPTCVCEVHHEYLARQGKEPEAVFGIFRDLGYRMFAIHNDGTLTSVEGYDGPGDYLFAHPDRFDVAQLPVR